MEICNCLVAIAGDPRATVVKNGVTVAEIVVLQHIHGDSAVTNIKVLDTIEKSNDEERYHLGKLYKDEKIVEIFGQYGELPKTLQDARIADTLLDAVWVNDSKKEAPKKTTKKTKTRARNSKGHYVPDDPSTPENEAFVEG